MKEWLLTPFPRVGVLTALQRRYNKKLCCTRCIVEQSFGDLKNRFRRLQYIDASVQKCVEYVVAACVIHNICIQNGDFFPQAQQGPMDDDELEYPNYIVGAGAVQKRNSVMNIL